MKNVFNGLMADSDLKQPKKESVSLKGDQQKCPKLKWKEDKKTALSPQNKTKYPITTGQFQNV